ncbi:MAG: GH116 family glycosyl hydrolase [Chloroflexota bacterium]|nr:GH116 family glycosyl hydrolase [Chloroflexota bacterium]
MTIAHESGRGERFAAYEVADDHLATGSTFGGPKIVMTIKATGAIERVFASDVGKALFGTVVLRHYDGQVGMHLVQKAAGRFIIKPEHQEHHFDLSNDVAVHEKLFVLSGAPTEGHTIDPPAAYYTVELQNTTGREIVMSTYAFADLRGDTAPDIAAEYRPRERAIIAWNASQTDCVRVFGCTTDPASHEVTSDRALAVASMSPGPLSGRIATGEDLLGVLQIQSRIAPGATASFAFILTFAGTGKRAALKAARACPVPDAALARTRAYYAEVLARSRVITPNPEVNRGVLWAKANMLRVMLESPTGWCGVNDPAHSNNSVGRDTAWFAYGADYLVPEFARESLLAYVRLQEESGMVVEYYDIRTSRTADYGLNINDNTPLLILALWHHFMVTGDRAFLEQTYPAAAKAADYLLSQRNAQGLVWCTATGTANEGIVGWRNVIPDYRLSGATAEVNSECYAALDTASQMARTLGRHDESRRYADEAAKLKDAINTLLRNPRNGLYYLSIDLDGQPRSDVTSDLVFPVLFGVAPDDVAARIVARLSDRDFWTDAGIRTTPRDAVNYSPGGAWGLLGGVWVGVTFWYAMAAAKYQPAFMDHALATSFRNYSTDPRKNNTVPGQFSEWLHGETLVNEGMMLSPWFAPRYLWAAIEGVAGLEPHGEGLGCWPHLAPDWKWLAVQDLLYRDRRITWFAVRGPEVQLFTNVQFAESPPSLTYDDDISSEVRVTGDHCVALGLRQGADLVLFVGNTEERTVTTGLSVAGELSGAYRWRVFDSLIGRWQESEELISADRLHNGIALQLERRGFWVLDLKQAV